MFEVGLSELLVILIVALVVIGPKRLPKVARTLGQWMGRGKRFIHKIKQDVDKSIELEELRQLENKVKAGADALERSVRQAGNDIDHQLQQTEKDIAQSVPAEKLLPPPRTH